MKDMQQPPRGREDVIEIIYAPLVGGSETLAFDLCKRWHARGIRVRICCLYEREGPLTQLFEREGIAYDLLDIGSKGLLGRWFTIGRYLRKHRPLAIHVHHFGLLVNVFVPAYLTGSANLVFTEHSTYVMARRGWMRRAIRFVVCFVSQMTCVSSSILDYFNRLGVPEGKMAVVYNGVDTNRFHPPAQRHSSAVEVRVVAVGRMVEEKDYPTLFAALAILKVRGYRFRAQIVGDGPLAQELALQHEHLGLASHVQLLGRRAEIPEILRRSDIYVLSSKSEGMPIALLEAMATGLAIAATSVEAVPEVIVDNVNGLLVPKGDERALADAIARLIDDPVLRLRLGARAIEDARTLFSIENATAMYARYLDIAS
ncbi:MAG: glycosyltransferase family 4 protein [Acidiferrobacteraceae bacterium]